jgi:hypothetical protein
MSAFVAELRNKRNRRATRSAKRRKNAPEHWTSKVPRWSVSMIRKKAEHLGTVTVSNARQAIENAAAMFDIPPERRNRIVVTKISDNDDD